jgi:methyl-accepting chemotaxis protein
MRGSQVRILYGPQKHLNLLHRRFLCYYIYMPQKTRVEKIITGVGSVTSLAVHTVLFLLSFLLSVIGIVSFDRMLLVLTTVLSLEAIYLAIFIQMTVNRQGRELAEVSEGVEDLQEDIEEIQKDVDEIQEDVGEIQEDVEEIHDESEETTTDAHTLILKQLTDDVRRLLADIERLKKE